MTVPLSILDLGPISAGSTAQQALRNTIDLARHAEQWGYHRYWLAEHHFVSVASSSSITLIGLVAAATQRIRVGSAAVQAGHHTSASIVEAFGAVERLAALRRVSGADELLVTSITHRHADRLESHRLLAEAWGLRAARAA